MRIYKITHVVNTTFEYLKEKTHSDKTSQNFALHYGGIVIIGCLNGRTCYYYTCSVCAQSNDVLRLVINFVKKYNKTFVLRRKENNPQIRFNQQTGNKKQKCHKKRHYLIKNKRKYTTYNDFAKIRGCFQHNIHYQNGRAFIYSRLRGKTIHYYIVKNENWLLALSTINKVIDTHNINVKLKRRKKRLVA